MGDQCRGISMLLPLVAVVLAVPVWTQAPAPSAASTYIPFDEVRSTFEALHEDWPRELRGLPPDALRAAWPDWVRRRDTAIRARLDRGYEDSIVNLWLYGTTFTTRPRVVDADVTQGARAASAADVLAGRLEDLLDAIANPGDNERLRFAREVFERQGLRPTTADGRARIRRALDAARRRARDEFRVYDRQVGEVQNAGEPGAALAVHATLFRDRGLSSDTSVLVGYAVDQALRGMVAARSLPSERVTRVGVIGPGLDFTNKTDGHDFYPQQTIQPFALIDSLLRSGLSEPESLRVTTFDVDARVDRHLESARRRATAGDGYTLHIPIGRQERWRPEFRQFWDRFGDRIGDAVPPAGPPAAASSALVRAIRVRPLHVLSIEPRDLNIVLERPAPLAPDDRFDLLVATNVLVYYDRFEQSLALANAAAMLRPGGVLLTNNAVFPIPPFKPAAHHQFVVYSERHTEHVFWYERQ